VVAAFLKSVIIIVTRSNYRRIQTND